MLLEGGNRATQQVFSMQGSNFPGDLLRKIVSGNDFPGKFEEPTQDSEEIELSLGLSLNGRFGVDPRAKLLPLKRSSSIPDFASTPARDEDTTCRVSAPCMVPLMRTCSLPTETEEEWRKRKELQSLRRMEAKRKRSEKQQRNLKVPRDRSRENFEEDKRGGEAMNGVQSYRQEQFVKVVDEFRAMGIPTWVSGDKGNCPVPPPPASQSTIGSQGSGSSGISESESHAAAATAAAAAQGVHKCTEPRSHANAQSSPKTNKELLVTPRMITTERSGQFSGVQMEINCDKPTVPEKGANEIVRNVLENMPCVSTKGDGPNGKRIEGFLYRYKKGEEVRIVCVCHGSFLSPAEFVKHAGGGDVAHPLKHIVVNPSPFL
ncbi:ABI five binding protein 2 [Prunus dulcis]|uniref:Ninja-family protein n=1 Tax=Prunus dulcis TaxID=3755 RepID=A0A4Y1R7Y5_PRUDU|nr:ABI five binding protein 2 [Prunus dulcis]